MAVPPHDDDEALEELDLEDAALVSQQSAAHAPVPRANVDVSQPSVVLADDLQEEGAPVSGRVRRKGKRSLEPTLVIRDRRQIDDLRRLRQQPTQAEKRGVTRAILMWGLLGLLAFALGGVIALFAAKGEQPLPDSETGAMPADETVSMPGKSHASPPPDAGARFIDLDAPTTQ